MHFTCSKQIDGDGAAEKQQQQQQQHKLWKVFPMAHHDQHPRSTRRSTTAVTDDVLLRGGSQRQQVRVRRRPTRSAVGNDCFDSVRLTSMSVASPVTLSVQAYTVLLKEHYYRSIFINVLLFLPDFWLVLFAHFVFFCFYVCILSIFKIAKAL